MPGPSKFSHVVLNTPQLRAMVDWYRTVLGAHIVHDAGAAVYMTYDDEHHRLALVDSTFGRPADSKPAAPAGEPIVFDPDSAWTVADFYAVLAGPDVGLSHMAYTFDTFGDLMDSYDRLAQCGVKPVLSVNHGPTTSMYYRDPDHHMVELQIDNFPPAEATAFMHTSTFADTQGAGWPFNPDEMLAQYRAGKSEQELLRPWELQDQH
jgi:catechol 2,3-dioxygenase-like lactoylglutathione lyase family enzyme